MGRRKESHFRGKVKKSSERAASKGGSKFDYLINPDDIPMYSPEPGTANNQLDFIPYEVTVKDHPDHNPENGTAGKGKQWYRREFRIHRQIGAGKNQRTIVCPESFGKKCPICEKRRELYAAKAPKEETRPLNSSLRYLYIVIPLNSKDHKKEIHLMDISNFCFQKEVDEDLATNEEYEIFPDLEEGLTLNCRWSSETIDAKSDPFAKISRIDWEKRKKQYKESILKKSPNLDKMFSVLSYDEIDKLFNEVEEVEETIDDSKSRKKKTDKKKDKKKGKKKEQPTGEELINYATTVEALLDIAKEYPGTFKADLKKLKKIEKVKKMKAKMLEISKAAEVTGDDDLPF